MADKLKPRPMLSDTTFPPLEPSDEEGEDVEVEKPERSLEPPALELEITWPDVHFSIAVSGEPIEKAKVIALEVYKETILKGR